jgi:hypothetical protein
VPADWGWGRSIEHQVNNWVENTSPVDADGDYASNCPFNARWSFPLRTRSPIKIGSSLGFIYLAYLISTQDLRRNLWWSINSSINCPTTLRSDRPHRCNRPLGNLRDGQSGDCEFRIILYESKRTATDVALPNFRLSSWKRSSLPSQMITSQQTRDSVP